MLGPQIPTQQSKFDVFVLMRADEDTKIHDKICRGITRKGYTCSTGDWGSGTTMRRHSSADGEFSPNHAEIGVQIALGTISIGEVIVTDRLHAVLLSFLAGKWVIYVDTPSKKIGGVLQTAFSGTTCGSENSLEKMGIIEVEPNTEAIVDETISIIKERGVELPE